MGRGVCGSKMMSFTCDGEYVHALKEGSLYRYAFLHILQKYYMDFCQSQRPCTQDRYEKFQCSVAEELEHKIPFETLYSDIAKNVYAVIAVEHYTPIGFD